MNTLSFLAALLFASSVAASVANETVPVLTNVLLAAANTTQIVDATAMNGTAVNASASNVGRSLNVQPGSVHTATGSASSASSTSSIVVILVSLIVVACIITLIVAALFVMRHRFSSWRLTGKEQVAEGEEGDSSNDKLTAETAAAVVKDEVDAAVVVTENECLTSVENKTAIAQIETAPVSSAVTVEEVTKGIEEAVACSETPLLTEVPAAVVDSTEVIKSPAKSVHNEVSEDSEKQPLNAPEQ